MTWTTNWHQELLRRCFAIALSSFVLTSCFWLALPQAFAVVVDTGIIRTASPLGTTVASIPASAGAGLEFTPADGPTANLGTFDIVISPSAALSANIPALNAFNRAAQLWESFISDPITVTINADFSALGAGILGSTGAVFLQADYNTIRNQLVADASNETDDAIVLSMPTAAQFSVTLPSGFAVNGNVTATKANLKAMGFTGLDSSFGVSDANIAFSTAFTWDFDKSNGISAGAFDFEGVAAHEIGHVLGFISSVDDVDFVLPSTATDIQPMPLDLFRFADGGVNDPATTAQFTTFPRNMVPGTTGIFDQVIGGQGGSLEVLFSTGVDFGDGRQASHWKDSLGLGIMDPTAAPGELLVLTANDRRAMDLIGYEVQVVPEASTLSLLLLGSALLCFGLRRE